MIFIGSSWLLTLAFIAFYLRAHRRLVLVARAAHELRGPLFAMQLGLHGLGGEPARVAAIELELQRAGRALDDLTAAPSGARAETSRELVDLTELVESYAPAWRALASGYGAELRVEPPLILTRVDPAELTAAWPRRRTAPAPPARSGAPTTPATSPRSAHAPPALSTRASRAAATTVFADPLRIAQACANLIGNAAEHGGGVVQVRIRAGGAHVRIEVADDGPGLPMSVTALTASARTRRGRRGHGLAIAAAIAEHHGGRLHAAPSDAGARLMLEMPAANDPVVA
ncbi:ATP-binding protein [Solirubrobacter ginsenosidimutans]|uniref:histidine kinase n=1 Tax=Solirubrobacter ginsenosidimutans TaxID=490573 RepID=A0A9X3S2R6_9ACTN|nr:ATP-binding protein [Solirubrobacter ginsenosidimutans]MDA0164865.1 ATP-binding protein [Solirubrobacter ginsenosidimutans]